MKPARWQRVQEVYLAALEEDPGTRDEWLERTCGGDRALRDEVRSLLDADETGDPLLEATLDDLLLLMDDEEGEAVAGAPLRAGPYTVGEEIGRGGMGRVFRGVRTDGQYTREVALKVVPVLAGADEVARRFRRERQILAALEHPNIARLYDAGISDEGWPWLAMELVEGEPIHRHCDRLRLDVEARLALFEQVLAGVDYAHRQLVIHRDLKPTNILVTGGGRVKLLDFGIAKLLEEEAGQGGEDPLTRAGQRLLTPEYASPEQLRGEPLSTASDVYSLGILLHSLLAGGRPEGEAARPSRALAGAGPEEARTIAADRSTTPARLRRRLAGELDVIVARALAPEVERRYPSAAALLDDLTRHRTGLPIQARPPSAGYRMRKFIGRNRTLVGAAAAVLLALAAGLGAALQQAREARQQRDVAQAVSGFLENTFTAATPYESSGERLDTLPIRGFLERAVARLDSDLGDQPEVRARMQSILGTVHLNLGIQTQARELLQAALDGYRELGGGESEETAEILRSLGRASQVDGDPATAETRYREVLEVAGRVGGEDSPQATTIRSELAGVLLDVNRLDEAAAMLDRAFVARRGQEQEEGSTAMADQLNRLGALQYRQGRMEEALATLTRSLELYTEVEGPDHPNTIILTQNMGFMLNVMGRFEEAESHLRRALEGMRESLGPDYPPIGPTLGTLATALDGQGRWEEADSLHRASIDFVRRVQGEESRQLAMALHDYGGALKDQGLLEEARARVEEALRRERALTGPRTASGAITQALLAEILREGGEMEAALAEYDEAVEIMLESFPPDHPRVLGARQGRALALAGSGRTAEAEDSLLLFLDQAGGLEEGGVVASNAARSLATFYEMVGNASEAARWRAASEGS